MQLELATGKSVGGRYEVRGFLGRGGMAAVYRAYDPKLNLDVALKVLPPHLAADAAFVARFRREGQTLAKLTHPNILRLYEIGEDERENLSYLVLEYLSGGSLKERARRQPRSIGDVVRLLRPVASALDFAHGQPTPVVHRDLKPSNIMFGHHDRAVVCDFGLAKLLEPELLSADGVPLSLTVNQVLGTPAYMAPEQADGLAVGPATDRYALGVVAYELLTGSVPFHADTARSTMRLVIYAPLPPPSTRNPLLSTSVDEMFAKALAKDPSQRFESAAAFVRALAAEAPVSRATAPGVVHAIQPPRGAHARSETVNAPSRRRLTKLSRLLLAQTHTRPAAATRPVQAPEPPRGATELSARARSAGLPTVGVSAANGSPRLWKPAAGVLLLGALATLTVLLLVKLPQPSVDPIEAEPHATVEEVGSSPAPIARPTNPPSPEPTATPLATAQATPTAQPTPTPTVDEAWQRTLAELDAVWNLDWPAAIQATSHFVDDHPEFEPAQEKLYAAHLFFADQLLTEGRVDEAVKQLESARAVLPNQPAAQQTLVALTPTATPRPSLPSPPAQPTPATRVVSKPAPQPNPPLPRPVAPETHSSAPGPQPTATRPPFVPN